MSIDRWYGYFLWCAGAGLILTAESVAIVWGFRRLRRARSGPVAPCPVRALCDHLKTKGWTVAMPFPIPEACHARTCGHTPDDAWALNYATRAEMVARSVEDGRLSFQEVDRLSTSLFRDGLPEELREWYR